MENKQKKNKDAAKQLTRQKKDGRDRVKEIMNLKKEL